MSGQPQKRIKQKKEDNHERRGADLLNTLGNNKPSKKRLKKRGKSSPERKEILKRFLPPLGPWARGWAGTIPDVILPFLEVSQKLVRS